jgi:hypothetical protein
MGADQDVHPPLAKALDRVPLLGGAAKARDVLDADRIVGKPLAERPIVLLGENRRWHEHQDLLAVGDTFERGPQRDLRLAVADVTADQPVHRSGRLHVGLDEFDRLPLVGCLGVGEASLKLALPVAVECERVPLAAATLDIERQQFAGQVLRGASGASLERLPARTAKLRKRRLARAGTDVAGDFRKLVGGRVDPVIALVLEQ